MIEGQLCLVLHAHLPFVRHPDFDRWLEEDWLFEAIIETYLPLLRSYSRLVEQRVPFRVTMTMSPTLMAMLSDDVLQKRFIRHIDRLIELAEKEVERTRWIPEFLPLAEKYLDLFKLSRKEFVEVHDWNLVQSFRRFQDAGVLELITCGATHGFLPLMLRDRNLWRGQILTAADDHERHFGSRPRGIWLPECGFESGVEEILAEAGIEYFFTDTHGILHATPRPRFGVYAPLRTPSGVCGFGRDQQSSRQVWSAEVGYPGDADYREFYRDVGWDLDYDYVKPYLHSDGNRTALGIKYYRVTREGDHKEPYDFARAKEKSARHAEDFLQRRIEQAKDLHGRFGRRPLVVSPYDAELFGHWWFEGPQFLEYFFLKAHYDQDVIELVTAGDYIDQNPEIQPAMPSMSSWGHNGYCEYWLDPANDWLYPLVQWAGEQMIELATDYPDATRGSIQYRALSQAARELVLAQSSDWAFILRAGSMVEYAKWRAEGHLKNFDRLVEEIRAQTIDETFLEGVEAKNNVFPRMDYRVWARKKLATPSARRKIAADSDPSLGCDSAEALNEVCLDVTVVPYDPSWPNAFAEESDRLAETLGDVATDIHHVGSTSIPGIFAKPIIDIMVEARDLASVDLLQNGMEKLGYEAMGEFGIPGRRYFRRFRGDGVRTHQVHVFERGSVGARRHLAFRDYLIAHPEVAHRYSDLKRQLAEAHPSDLEAYMDGKDSFIKDVECTALEASTRTSAPRAPGA